MRALAAAALLVPWPEVGLHAQGTGRLEGRVYDEATGCPLAGALVSPTWFAGGRTPVDSTGHYMLRYLQPGAGMLEVTCPSKSAIGRPTPLQVAVFVQDGRTMTLDVPVEATGCTEPLLSARYGVHHGIYRAAFESYRFEPCPDSTGRSVLWDNPYWGRGAWIFFTESARRQLAVSWDPTDTSTTTFTYYARFRGALSGPGAFGRRYGLSYKIEVDSLLEFRLVRPTDCS